MLRRGGAGLARLDLLRVVRVAAADVAPPHAQAVILVLPHVAQLVCDQARGAFGERLLEQDQRPHLVAVEAAEPREPEEPRDVEDADAADAHRRGIEVELIQRRLRLLERGKLSGAAPQRHSPTISRTRRAPASSTSPRSGPMDGAY